ncbi:hypothetical protein [Dyella sp.]|uniref:hypothetical protein n=1 Tax=Dyella sp. TaxID=1869338 RepID=UPI002FD90A1D
MKTLIFGGYSDDTFGEVTPGGDDFDNCASGNPIEWLVESASEHCSLIVFGQYCPSHANGWLVGVAPHDESGDDLPLPAWPMRIKPNPDRPFEFALEVDVPDDTTIRCLQRLNQD